MYQMLQVYNKIDLMPEQKARIDRNSDGVPVKVWLSAVSGEGLGLLLNAVNELLSDDVFHDTIVVKPKDGQLRAYLYAQNAVLGEQIDDDGGMRLDVRIQRKDLLQILSRLGMATEQYRVEEVY